MRKNILTLLLVLNGCSLAVAGGFGFLGYQASLLGTRLQFTELDRAGVINANALKQFPPSYGFGNVANLEYRTTVPKWLTEGALEWFALSCVGAGFLAALNIICVCLIARQPNPTPPVPTS